MTDGCNVKKSCLGEEWNLNCCCQEHYLAFITTCCSGCLRQARLYVRQTRQRRLTSLLLIHVCNELVHDNYWQKARFVYWQSTQWWEMRARTNPLKGWTFNNISLEPTYNAITYKCYCVLIGLQIHENANALWYNCTIVMLYNTRKRGKYITERTTLQGVNVS